MSNETPRSDHRRNPVAGGIGGCVNVNLIGEEVDVNSQGQVDNIDTSAASLAGVWTFDPVDFGGQVTLPAGSIVTGATVTASVTSSFDVFPPPGFIVSGDATIDSLDLRTSCDGGPLSFTEFTNAPAHTVTDSFTPCFGQVFFAGVGVSGDASYSGFVSPLPTTPGSYLYLASMSQNVNYTVDVDYAVPTVTPEPAELLPMALLCGLLVLFATRRHVKSKSRLRG